MHYSFDRWAGGKVRCLTMSYDDGRTSDRRLVDIFNAHGIRGSFHLNAGFLGNDGYVTPDEISALYSGHEISAHGYTHPFLSKIPESLLAGEILDDRRTLEALAGYPVRGMSYPFGDYSPRLMELLEPLGIEYARTVAAHNNFSVPGPLLAWHPTCHHRDENLQDLLKRFLDAGPALAGNLLYVWGHSYEFDHADNWQLIEEFCATAGGHSDTWYATNIEVADYLNAVRRLKASVDGSMLTNPSGVSVWVSGNQAPVEIPPGQTVTAAT